MIWIDLDHVSCNTGYSLWPYAFRSSLKSPDLAFPLSSGFGYASPMWSQTVRGSRGLVGTVGGFNDLNTLRIAAKVALIPFQCERTK